MSSNILIIIKFNNNFDKIIPAVMLLVPRTSLFLSVYLFIYNDILKSNKSYDIKLNYNNNYISWFYPVGVYYDIINSNYLNLVCNRVNKSEKYNIFDIDMNAIANNKTINIIVQHRLKHGLGTIFNSTKAFMDLNVQEVEKYISFVLFVNNNNYYDLEENFYNILNKIYNKKKSLIRCPLVIHIKNKMDFFAPEINEGETLKDIIWRCGVNINFLENTENIIINGISFEGWKNIPVLWAVKNMCSSDLFIHIIIRN